LDLHDGHFSGCGGNRYDTNSFAEKCSRIEQGMGAFEENYRSFRPSLEAGGNVTTASGPASIVFFP
jgi:hypothetical protein